MKPTSHIAHHQAFSQTTPSTAPPSGIKTRHASLAGTEMRRRVLACLVLLLGFGGCALHGQNPAPDKGKPAADKKMSGLLVYGTGFMFAATEPDGWHGDTEKIARDYYSNLIFLPKDRRSRAAHVNIRVRVNNKETTDPSQDMQTDMAGYKAKYPQVKFSDLALSHPKYKICAKLFAEENAYYEYVVYVDPGPDVKKNFSVSMSKDSIPATPEEMKALESVLHSLFWISGNIHYQ